MPQRNRQGARQSKQSTATSRARWHRIIHATDALLRPSLSKSDIQRALRAVGLAFDAHALLLHAYPEDGVSPSAPPRYEWVRDSGSAASSSYAAQGDRTGSTAVHTIPVHVQGTLWGTLQLQIPSHHGWSSDDRLLLETVARHLGAALSTMGPASTRSEPGLVASKLSLVAESLRQMEAQNCLYGSVALLSAQGDILFHSDRFALTCAGNRAEAETPFSFATCLAPASLPLLHDALNHALDERAERTVQVHTRDQEAGPVRLRLVPVLNDNEASCGCLCWASTPEAPDGKVGSYADALERRMRADRALLKASRLLVGSLSPPFGQLLHIIGEATGAVSIQLAVADIQQMIRQSTLYTESENATAWTLNEESFSYYMWTRPDAAASSSSPSPASDASTAGEAPAASGPDGTVCTTTPILSADGSFYGYIRLEYEPSLADSRNKDRQILSVLSEMISSTLERHVSREAFQREKQRYSHFVSTISEAIFRIDLARPIHDETSVDRQVDRLKSDAVVAECNTAMARLFGHEAPHSFIGRSLYILTRHLDPDVLRDLVEADYQLRNYRLELPGSPTRYFVVNTTAMTHEGQVESLWVSCTEVTEQVMLERRMVEVLEQQQQRMGRDLHDLVGQQLAGTRMLIQNLSDRYFGDSDENEGRRAVQRIVEGVRSATRDISDLQRTVMPIQVSRDGLGQALRELVSHADQHTGVRGTYVHDGTDVRDDETKRQLYRIAQEAVRNALKHADASTIEVTLRTEGETLLLQVADDGTAFDPGRIQDVKAVGLYSMRYRARLIGASLDIHTSEDSGTRVTCRLPHPASGSSSDRSVAPFGNDLP